MSQIEEINSTILQLAQEVNSFYQTLNLQDQYLNYSFREEDKETLVSNRRYIEQHKEEMSIKKRHLEEEWTKLSQSRSFDYQKFGEMIASIVTQVEGVPYHFATRLVKHSFQIDESWRPFYQVVSFITPKEDDLEPILLEELSSTMIPFYMPTSPFIKPLESEIASTTLFEQILKQELEIRRMNHIYIETVHDIPEQIGLEKPINRTRFLNVPFLYLNDVIEEIIAGRYYRNGHSLEPEEIQSIVSNFCEKNKSVVNF